MDRTATKLPKRFSVVLSCEHASCAVPKPLEGLLTARALQSHRGFDPGALGVARLLAKATTAPLHFAEVSRLVIDLNRSLHHHSLHAAALRKQPPSVRDELVRRYHAPFRAAVAASVREAIASSSFALHLSVHSFTPVLDGERRRADLGLLYDPARSAERAFATHMQSALEASLPALRVRRNYPYRGTADGHTTALRRTFSARRYAGIELELNQAWITAARTRALIAALARVLAR
jgi:predicted N-formylglutamate amidohydrolase